MFFSPRGKALVGAPPRKIDLEGGGGEPAPSGPPPSRPGAGIPRWTRDAYIPWEVEARAWEALDAG